MGRTGNMVIEYFHEANMHPLENNAYFGDRGVVDSNPEFWWETGGAVYPTFHKGVFWNILLGRNHKCVHDFEFTYISILSL